MTPGPRVVAITVNWNRPEETLECIRSLRAGGVQGLETVVVDNGSDPRSVESIRLSAPEARIIVLGRNEGYVRGANAGLREAMKSDFTHFLLINNDAFGEPGFVAQLLEGLARHSSAGIVGPKILYPDRRRIWFAGGEFNRTWGYSTHPLMDEEDRGTGEERKVDFVTGCVMLVRREGFEEVGLFDEDFEMYAEDLDLCLRAEEKGFESWYVPSAVAFHKVSSSAGIGGSNIMTPFRARRYARNMLLLIAKRMRGLRYLTCLLGQLIISLPYYSGLIAIQRSRGALGAYLGGVVEGMKFNVGGRARVEA